MDSETVPAELWMEIFELLPNPSDLYSIMCASKRFHDLAVRAIHRHVIWKTPPHVAHNLPIWDHNPGMEIAIRALELGVSALPAAVSGNEIDLSGQSTWRNVIHPGDARMSRTLAYHSLDQQAFASIALHNAMLARINTFVNLESLALVNLLMSNDHFALIRTLPRLCSLRIEYCVVPTRNAVEPFDYKAIPITELALLNLRRPFSEVHREMVIEDDLTTVLNFALAHDLRTLRIDSTADVFRHVFSARLIQRQAHAIPARLARLFIQRRQLPQPPIPGEATFPDGHLYAFLAHATSLTTYSTYHPVPSYQLIASGALPQLRCYSGPVESVANILPDRPIEALQLLQCTHGQSINNNRDGLNALAHVATALPELPTLSVGFARWDDEILHAIARLFPKLQWLQIVYGHGGPSEDMMVKMGPELLARLPNLQTLKLYRRPAEDGAKPEHPSCMFDESFDSIEEELRNLVIPWNRWCPALREVQLISGYTMLRGYSGGPWNLLRLKRLEDIGNFQF
ncbi:hypothetical protein WOLCODRAFT_77723 [Wolfiporia cocos MD-104 SS10]|uniref:F-box domain-containing protein n=1 Tax=Wolfiporia cocos (strain MD-104) TaxID=742152 RepID=A0A2H3JR62_WOLCO|nr:hypothetical protein WOLCODRAFT_77723 [Wolfiporia cocos MD-104 SS10]